MFDENGEKNVHLIDPFDICKQLKGSPKYWQVARNELVAKVKQLGPFHVFFTFSCGEMRWAEVFLSLLMRKGRTIIVPSEWDGNENEVMVEENGENIPLWEYINERMSESKHDLSKDYTFLITRLFDTRVKSFITNILMGGGRKVKFSHWSYGVEFQARGMPHIHGVAWIEEESLKKFGIEKQFLCDENEDNVVKLVDELITCQIPMPLPLTQCVTDADKEQRAHDEKLKKTVLDVQVHHHTKS